VGERANQIGSTDLGPRGPRRRRKKVREHRERTEPKHRDFGFGATSGGPYAFIGRILEGKTSPREFIFGFDMPLERMGSPRAEQEEWFSTVCSNGTVGKTSLPWTWSNGSE